MKNIPYILYENGKGAADSIERMNIYVPSNDAYVCYSFGHVVDKNINADNWRIVAAYSCDEEGQRRFRIVDSGEWEMAIMLEGRPDYIGGNNHGNEVVEEIAFSIDGEECDITCITDKKDFKTVSVFEKTRMFDPSETSLQVAVHEKNYVFDAQGLTLTQSVYWKTVCDVTCGYMAMLPVIREDNWNNRLKITGKDGIAFPAEYSLSKDGTNPTLGRVGGVLRAEIASDAGFTASFEMTKNVGIAKEEQFFVTSSPARNKMYFLCTDQQKKHVTSIGECWKTQTIYKIKLS